MKLDYVPLLRIQRDLHDIPRGPERFRQYLRTILKKDGTDVALPPLVLMNPMGRDHVAARLDALLALDADGVAARAAADAQPPRPTCRARVTAERIAMTSRSFRPRSSSTASRSPGYSVKRSKPPNAAPRG